MVIDIQMKVCMFFLGQNIDKYHPVVYQAEQKAEFPRTVCDVSVLWRGVCWSFPLQHGCQKTEGRERGSHEEGGRKDRGTHTDIAMLRIGAG